MKTIKDIANELGINHVCLANELNLKDILEISKFTDGNITEDIIENFINAYSSKRALMMDEIWKDVPKIYGNYEVSNKGNVRHKKLKINKTLLLEF